MLSMILPAGPAPRGEPVRRKTRGVPGVAPVLPHLTRSAPDHGYRI